MYGRQQSPTEMTNIDRQFQSSVHYRKYARSIRRQTNNTIRVEQNSLERQNPLHVDRSLPPLRELPSTQTSAS